MTITELYKLLFCCALKLERSSQVAAVLENCDGVLHLALSPAFAMRLGVGLIALALLLAVEFTFVLWLLRLTIGECFASRDLVAGTVYIVMLGIFTIMPLLVARR